MHQRAPRWPSSAAASSAWSTAWRAAQRGPARSAVVDPDPAAGPRTWRPGCWPPSPSCTTASRPCSSWAWSRLARVSGLRRRAGRGDRACDLGYRAVRHPRRRAGRRRPGRSARAARPPAPSGLESQWLTGRECRRLEPMLAPGVRGGLRVDGDHQVDPRRLAAALLAAAERAGVRAASAGRGGGRPRLGGRADRRACWPTARRSRAGQVVLAAGSLSGAVAGLPPDVLPPVRPVKGQILRLRRAPATRAWRRVPAPPCYPHRAGRRARPSVYLVPRENGELVRRRDQRGAGLRHHGHRGRRVRAAARRPRARPRDHRAAADRDRRRAAARLPGQRAAARAATALPGLLLATGHHRNGVLLTPVTADADRRAAWPTGELPGRGRAVRPRPRSHAAARQEQPA